MFNLQDPLHSVVKFRVHGANVFKSDRLAEKHFIKRKSETTANMMTMKESNAQDSAHELKIRQMIL